MEPKRDLSDGRLRVVGERCAGAAAGVCDLAENCPGTNALSRGRLAHVGNGLPLGGRRLRRRRELHRIERQLSGRCTVLVGDGLSFGGAGPATWPRPATV
jgi:hypothetical protein